MLKIAIRHEGSRFRLEVIYKGEEYDPFLILSDDGEKAESRKAKERNREQSHHAEDDEEYDYEVRGFACFLFQKVKIPN